MAFHSKSEGKLTDSISLARSTILASLSLAEDLQCSVRRASSRVSCLPSQNDREKPKGRSSRVTADTVRPTQIRLDSAVHLGENDTIRFESGGCLLVL